MSTTLNYTAPWPVLAFDWCNTVGPSPSSAQSTPSQQSYYTPATYKSRPSSSPPAYFRLVLGSYIENFSNSLQIIGLRSEAPLSDPDADHGVYDEQGVRQDFAVLAEAQHGYPATKVAWEPASMPSHTPLKHGRSELLASTAEMLKIWEYSAGDGGAGDGSGYVGRGRSPAKGKLTLSGQLTNSKNPGNAAPLTSFSWNDVQPSHIVTSSIDTTCTVWDLNTRTAITQLIAHDREVYDVSWLPGSTDIFTSVGADGSLRAFDLRSLEHSTILYETAPPQSSSSSGGGSSSSSKKRPPVPLLRIQFNPSDPNYIATFRVDTGEVNVLDMRAPGAPVANVRGHDASVTALAWKPDPGLGGGGGLLATGGDDRYVQIWDPSHVIPPSSTPSTRPSSASSSVSARPGLLCDPILAYTAPAEVNSLAWSKSLAGGASGYGEWLGVAAGRHVRALRV